VEATEAAGRVRYSIVKETWEDKPRRVRVVKRHGFEGYVIRITDTCSGCFEGGDYNGNAHHYGYDEKAGCSVGSGCEECGYTGKRRCEWFVVFDERGFQEFLDRRYIRRCRLERYFRDLKERHAA